MRAGKLDQLITIESSTYEIDDMGTPVYTWSKVADMRAQIVQASTEEFMRAYGTSDEDVIIFRTRYIAGVDNSDRIAFAGSFFDIKEIKVIGRNRGLELRCVRLDQ